MCRRARQSDSKTRTREHTEDPLPSSLSILWTNAMGAGLFYKKMSQTYRRLQMLLRRLWPGFGFAQCRGSDQAPFFSGVPSQYVGFGRQSLIGASLHIRTRTDEASPLAIEKLDSCKLAMKYDNIMAPFPSLYSMIVFP